MLVLVTKARAADRARRLAVIEGELRGLFQGVANQPVPGRLELVVEALEEQAAIEARPAAPTASPPAPARAKSRRKTFSA